MSELSYKQLHQVSCGSVDPPARVSLVDCSAYGYISCAISESVLLYSVNRYLEASKASPLRRDKAIPDLQPDVRIKTTCPVSWIAFNCDGLVLAVITSNASQGTFVNLVDLHDALKSSSSDLVSISRPLRVCGGEPLSPDGQLNWELRDFGWSPAAQTAFAVILRCGAVRLFHASPHPSSEAPQTLVNQLPSNVDALCLSWSGKGKQLALCLGGTLSTQSGTLRGPLILQVDPELRMKRVIQLNPTLTRHFSSCTYVVPLDLLWVSPACFILGVQSISAAGILELNALLVHAPSKSTEIACVEIPDLRGSPASTHHWQYYFHAIGNNHFLASHSADGEEVMLFAMPSISANALLSPPSNILTIELPPDGSPLGSCLGYFRESQTAQSLSYFLVSRLTNGCFSPYLLLNLDTIAPPPSLLPTPLEIPLPLASQSPDQHSTAVTTQYVPTESADFVASTQVPWTPKSSESQIKTQVPYLFPLSKAVDSFKHTPMPTSSCPITSSNEHSDPAFPTSVQIASAQFMEALHSEAEAGRSAWLDMFDLMKNGPQVSGEKSHVPMGIDAIETKLLDTESFLNALDKVILQLKEGCTERKRDFINCVEYTDKLRRSLFMCPSGDFAPILVTQLDPQAARWLNRVKRKERMIESSLLDMDAQLDALSAQFENRVEPGIAVNRMSTKHPGVAEDKLNHTNRILHTLDTITDLIRLEKGRVEYIKENFKRLNSLPTVDKRVKVSSLISTPRTMRSIRDVEDGEQINPVYQRLSDRDRFLYKLFANHRVPTIYTPKVCPTLRGTAEESDALDIGLEESLDPHPAAFQRGQSTNILQLKLEKLLEISGSVASADSPVKESSVLPDSKVHETSSASNSPSASAITPFSRILLGPKPNVSVGSTDQTPSSPLASFILGQKTAFFPPPGSPTVSSEAAKLQDPITVSSNGFTVPRKADISISILSSAPSVEPTILGATTSTSPMILSNASTTTSGASHVSISTTPAASLSTTVGFIAVASPIVSTCATQASTTQSSAGLFGTPSSGFTFGGNLFGPPVTSIFSVKATTSGTATGGLFSFAQNTQPSSWLFGQSSSPSVSTTFTVPKVTSTLTLGTTSTSAPLPSFSGLFSSVAAPSIFAPSASVAPTTSFFGPNISISSPKTSATVSSSSTTATNLLFGASKTTANSLTPFASPLSSSVTTTTAEVTSPGKRLFDFGSLAQTAPSSSTVVFGGLFGVPVTAAANATAPLTFGSAATTSSSSSGFTFGLPTTSSNTAAVCTGFPVTSTTTVSTAVQLPSATQAFTGLFTQPAHGVSFQGNLFGFASNKTTFGVSVPTTAANTTLLTTTTAASTAGGLFQSPTTYTSPFGHNTSLFGQKSPGSTGSNPCTDISNLFSGSTFGLGSAQPLNQTQDQNAFGRPIRGLGFGATQPTSGGLFSGAASTSQGSVGLFGTPVLASNQSATSPTSPGLFDGANPNPTVTGGLFGALSAQQSSHPSVGGGFGSRPVFGDSPFVSATGSQSAFAVGGATAFGSPTGAAIFGGVSSALTAPVASNKSFFGANNPAVAASGGGLFAALAAKTDSLTFGSLAMGAPSGTTPVAPASPFGASPSFTQRRA
ncbi:unnamed protein product [Dicrocoelium dendriticum]|nr:unnamed protein product [Dicrocoelium dendriticum]